jgi:hypothetical protein
MYICLFFHGDLDLGLTPLANETIAIDDKSFQHQRFQVGE